MKLTKVLILKKISAPGIKKKLRIQINLELVAVNEGVKNESTDLIKVLFVIFQHALHYEHRLSCFRKISIHFACPLTLIVQRNL